MGKALSCLRPEARDFQGSPTVCKQAGDVTGDFALKADVCRKPVEILAPPSASGGVKPVGADGGASVVATDTEGCSAQIKCVPIVPHPANHHPPPDSILESSQLGTSVPSTVNLQSTFSVSSGFPYNSWEGGPPHTDHEAVRVQALRALDILDSVSARRRARLDEEADMVLSALMQMFHAMTAMLVFFEDSRIVVRNAKGVIGAGEFPYRWSFCAYTLTKQRPQTLVVPDATKDMRFADNPFVLGEPHVRFYCGAPLVAASGHILGTLCFADSTPRPGFDAAQCYLLNNMAELMVRQLERFKPNAGPAGPIDAETTALTRVARTIECYEAVTGLVDISLGSGWMMMYVNEAWEQICAPWSRKQLVGRPLQVLLTLEQDSEQLEGASSELKESPKAGAGAQGLLEGCKRDMQMEEVHGTPAKRAGAGAGAGAGFPAHALWSQYAAALRQGEEVVVETARLMLEAGRPSTALVRVVLRPANFHVLDAATVMPVGVPPQIALPPSITAAADPSQLSAARSTTGAAVPEGHSSSGTTAERSDPFYCFVTLTPLQEAAANGTAASSGSNACRGQPKALQPAVGLSDSRRNSSAGFASGAAGAETPQPASGWVNGPHTGGYDLSARASNSNRLTAGRPSMDTAAPAGGGPSSSRGGGRLFAPGDLAAAALAGAAAAAAPPGGAGVTGAASCSTRGRLLTGASDTQSVVSWTYGMEPIPGLRLGHLLGKGGYGRVFSAFYRGKKVAAKVISNSMLKGTTCVNGVTLEALLAQEIEHPYIVRTYKCVVRMYSGLGGGGGGSGVLSARPSVAERRSQLGPSGSRASSQGLGAATGSIAAVPSAASVVSRRNSVQLPGADGAAAPGRGSVAGALPAGLSTRSEAATPAAVAAANVAAGEDPRGPAAASGAGQGASSAASPAAGQSAASNAGGGTEVATAESHVPPAEASPAAEEFDSFDVGGDEDGSAMIDHLVSRPGRPTLSHAGPSYTAARDGAPCLPSAGSFANGSMAGGLDNFPSALTATAEDEKTAAALAPPGTPPRLPAAAAIGSVFGAAAAAAAADAAGAGMTGMSLRTADGLPDGETWILQEYCTGGTLQDAIETGRLRTEPSRLRGKPYMPTILLTAQEIVLGMQCLHNRGYMHGDLSAVNVLLTEVAPGAPAEATRFRPEDGVPARGWVAKVSDFGLAKHLPDPKKPYISSAYGVITHCAPEVLKSLTQTQKADVYSFGVLLWQMWTGSRPWANMNRFQILGAVTGANSTGLRFLPDAEPPARYRDLTLRCLSYDPAARPTFAEICEELRVMTYEAASAGLLRG